MLFKRRRERNRGKKKKVTAIMKKTIGTKLITYIKRLKLKIQSRVWNFKNTMLKKGRRKRTREKEKKKTKPQKL